MRKIIKKYRIIKFTILLSFILALFFPSVLLAKTSLISIDKQDCKISEIIKIIEDNSKYTFFLNTNLINVNQKKNFKIANATVAQVLKQYFKGTGYIYEIVGQQITLKPAPTQLGKGQENTVRGKILDVNGTPLPGVTVSIKGTTTGSISDINGYYVIKAQKGETLQFSFVGFKTKEMVVGKSTSGDIIMEEDVHELEETVIVGMGKQRKASVIGSISSVSISDLEVPQRNLTNALSGRIAGAVVVQRSGEPGKDNADFWVRGISSFGANQKPLILVDGVERDMSDLSIEEVESISILKDASATAVYGVRAANGVVLVTTRKGIAQKPVIELKLEGGFSDLPNTPQLLDGVNYAKLANEALGYEQYDKDFIRNLESGANPYLYPNVNWTKELFSKFSFNTNAAINIRGGGERARYYLSASFLEDNGNLKNSPETDYQSNIKLRRYNFRSNIDLTLTKTTNLSLEIGANMTDMHQPGIGNEYVYDYWYTPTELLYYYCYLSNPLSTPVRVPIGRDAFGNYEWGWGAPIAVGEVNPAERLFGSGYNKSFRSQIMSQINLKQDLSFITKGLELQASFSFDSNNETIQNRRKYSSTYSITGIDDNTGDFQVVEIVKGSESLGYGSSSYNNRAEELKVQLNYNRIFNDIHRVGAMAMYYQRDFVDQTASSANKSLPYKKQGLAFRATYSFKDRYFIEGNLGYNGSENFPKGKRFGVFPAGALGYLISEESFWRCKPINFLKIRGSVGLVGSESLPDGMRFGYLSFYGGGLGGYHFGMTPTYNEGIGEDQVGVSDLTWEKGFKKDIGIELKMFDNMISLDADYFHERRSDILIQRQSVPATVGMIKQPFANMGVMVNQGFDGTLEFNHSIGDFKYKLYGNMTYTRNKIIEMDEAPKKYAYRMQTGHRYGQQFGLIALGLFKDQAEINESPEQKFGEVRPGDVKYLDYNGDGVVDVEDQCPIGYSAVPEIVYGFGAQFFWKGFDFGIFFRGQAHVTYGLGGDTFIPFNKGVGKGNLFKKALDRWTPENPNPNAFYPRLSNAYSANNWQKSTRTHYDGSLLRLADLELGYSFNKKWISFMGMKSLRIYCIASNVALFSKWDMWDPETASFNGSKYPLPRKVNFGIRTSF